MGIEAPRKLAMLSFLLMTFIFFLIKGYLMKTVRFDRTGVPVSHLCFGTMSFGDQVDASKAKTCMQRAAKRALPFLIVQMSIAMA